MNENLPVNKKLNTVIIQKKLEELGLNQTDLAKKLDVSKETISQWIRNQKFPRPAKLLKLGQVLKLSFNEIVEKISLPEEPIVAFRKKGNHKIKQDYLNNAKYMGVLLEELVNYLPFDIHSKPPSLIEPKIEYNYIHKVADEIRNKIGVSQDAIIKAIDLVDFFLQLHTVLIPVFWGNKENHENALHVYLPQSMTTWVFLNLDSKIHDFKFWMAHELGHIKALSLIGDEAEDFADYFAGALLISNEMARKAFIEIEGEKNISHLITFLVHKAIELKVSPITVYFEIKKYANQEGKSLLDLEKNGDIYKATSNFNKGVKTIAQSFFSNEHPLVSEYIAISKKEFKTPIFDSIKRFLRESGKSAGFLQNVFNIPLADAQYLYEELC